MDKNIPVHASKNFSGLTNFFIEDKSCGWFIRVNWWNTSVSEISMTLNSLLTLWLRKDLYFLLNLYRNSLLLLSFKQKTIFHRLFLALWGYMKRILQRGVWFKRLREHTECVGLLSKLLTYPIKALELNQERRGCTSSVYGIIKMYVVSCSSWTYRAASGRPLTLQSIT